MPRARFSFEGDLSIFLLPSQRGHELERSWSDTDTLMHVIETIGIPHTEVGRIEHHGDLIHVHPPTPEHLDNPRFILDQHLGRLAAYLRMLGFDLLHTVPAPDEQLAATSSSEDRVLLTRDVGLLKRKEVRRGYFVRATNPRTQLAEVVHRFSLLQSVAPFTRCIHCNTPLCPVEKALIVDRLPDRVAEVFDEFTQCPTCLRVYWKGSHYDRMQALIAHLREQA